ncbi:MAG: mannonate dehydratase [Vicinamibacteraceae bacterium]
MKIAAVAKQFTQTNLQLLCQVGVEDLIYYSLGRMPTELDELTAIKRLVEKNGLRLSGVEGGPPIDKIVLAKEGRDQQIADYKKGLVNMGKLGMKMLCYNFMPQVSDVAMVVRTSMRFPERGGAPTSQFRTADLQPSTVPHDESPTNDEQMWENLEHFLRQIVPVAEDADVKLAMHPDDPPLSPLCGLARIMRSVESFDRLVNVVDSPVNGITLCQGCFAEMGRDLPSTIRHFAPHINFVHFRDVLGTPEDFHETFPDNGPTNMVDVLGTYREIGYNGFVRVDHVPLLATESGEYDGYGMHGHVFAIGYLKGLTEAIFAKPGAAA